LYHSIWKTQAKGARRTFLCYTQWQLRLEGSGRWRNYSAGNLQGSAGIHCPISQRRPAHSGGAAHHHPDPPPGRLYLRAHLSNHSQRGVHHWPHRQAVSGL